MLEVLDVSKQYYSSRFRAKQVFAVRDVSISIVPGRITGLVGESGSGKTTLGHLASGLLLPTSGNVILEGTDIHSVKREKKLQIRRDIQVIFQSNESALDPRMTTYHLIREPLVVHDLDASDASVFTLMEKVGLGKDLRARYPHELSGGQRQRICIARALALSPRYLIADEPAASLDYSVQAQVLELLQSLQRENQIGMLFISHHLKIIRFIADEVMVMYRGKIVEKGPTNLVFAQPLHPYTRDLLAALPGFHRRTISSSHPRHLHPQYGCGGCTYYSRCTRRIEFCLRNDPVISLQNIHAAACFFPME